MVTAARHPSDHPPFAHSPESRTGGETAEAAAVRRMLMEHLTSTHGGQLGRMPPSTATAATAAIPDAAAYHDFLSAAVAAEAALRRSGAGNEHFGLCTSASYPPFHSNNPGAMTCAVNSISTRPTPSVQSPYMRFPPPPVAAASTASSSVARQPSTATMDLQQQLMQYIQQQQPPVAHGGGSAQSRPPSGAAGDYLAAAAYAAAAAAAANNPASSLRTSSVAGGRAQPNNLVDEQMMNAARFAMLAGTQLLS